MRAVVASVCALFLLSGCALLGGASVEEMQLTVGECILDEAVNSEGEQEVGALPVVDCTEPHDGEVFYTEDLAGDDLPADVATQAEEICIDNFESYVGAPYETSRFYFATVYPSSDTWRAGDRQIACVLTGGPGEKLTESARGSGE